ncbi:HNH endonuclease [Micromonospora humida]|uniref:HNH endonuclease n=1 Tax=Micromonospora humida TaxID=2809018 RepID=UPI003434247D
MQKPCAICQVSFDAKRSDAKYCSKRCGRRGTKPCSTDGCQRPSCVARPRRLCSTHYNARYTPEQRHPKRHTATCVVCGKQWSTGRSGREICSDECRSTEYSRRGLRPPAGSSSGGGRPWSRRTRAKRKLAKAARGSTGSRWVAGRCERCGKHFISALGSELGRYCSNTCKRRARSSRRRARERNAYSERYSRHHIFERDRWRCHICKRKTLADVAVPHPRAPVVDHLVPLAEGGDDTAANVATACFLCNSTKRERGGGEQLALIG